MATLWPEQSPIATPAMLRRNTYCVKGARESGGVWLPRRPSKRPFLNVLGYYCAFAPLFMTYGYRGLAFRDPSRTYRKDFLRPTFSRFFIRVVRNWSFFFRFLSRPTQLRFLFLAFAWLATFFRSPTSGSLKLLLLTRARSGRCYKLVGQTVFCATFLKMVHFQSLFLYFCFFFN